MNSTTAYTPSDAERAAALAELRTAIHSARDERAPYIAAAREAAGRLAKACLYHDNSQAVTVARALASIYNGSEAPTVRLDEIRWLDWSLQRDLLAVMVGTGDDHTPDTHIRDAFRAIGGEDAVEWFHGHLTETSESQKRERAKKAELVRDFLTADAHAFARSNPGKCLLLHGSKHRIDGIIEDALHT